MESRSDVEIIREVLKGNTNAFELLVHRYQERTFGFCYRILKDDEKATEAAHLSFIKAFENLGKFRKEARFSTWFYRIVYNICLDQCRYDKRIVREDEDNSSESWSPSEINAGLEYLGAEDKKRYLYLAQKSLTPEEAALIHQFYYDDLSIAELAETSGMKPGNIKIRLFRARKKMYAVLENLLNEEVTSLIK